MLSDSIKLPIFLVASPRLAQTSFEETVILLLQWNKEGAMGFVINLPLNQEKLRSMSATKIIEFPDKTPMPTHYGGPVHPDGILMLDTSIERHVFADNPVDLKDLQADEGKDFFLIQPHPDDFQRPHGERIDETQRIFLGYSGWDSEQLDQEVNDGDWLLLDFDYNLFKESAFDGSSHKRAEFQHDIWKRALDRIGLDSQSLLHRTQNLKIQ